MKVFFAVLLTASVAFGQEVSSGPIVSTQYGKVQGAPAQSRDGRMFYSFRGIPYGKAAERFQAPTLPDKWENVRDATGEAPQCIQYLPKIKEIRGVEDCLNLNVFTPKLPESDPSLLPVIVYIHPGLNNVGNNEQFDARYFMDENVIIVVINYRLGLFGFLSTGDKIAQGNAGLRDQIQALKWIKENIGNFGGDKDRVTLLGSGSGGADAFIHTISPLSKGLIHGVVSMGGSTLSRTSFILHPVRHAKRLGQQLECPVDSSENLVQCLRGKDAKEILEKKTKFSKKALNVDEVAWFGPTVDVLLDGQTVDDLVVPDNPVALLKGGNIINKVPLIIGGNEHEGVNAITANLLKNETLFERLDAKFDQLAPTALIYRDSAVDKDVVTSKIREFYFKDKPISKDTFENVTNLFMDRFMGFGVVTTARLYSKHAPTYLYYFSHKPTTSSVKFLGIDENYGMAHLDDIQYLFKINSEKIPFPEITKDHAEYQLSKDLVRLLGSFSETGKPTKLWGEAKEWPNVDAGEANKWYRIGVSTALKSPPPENLAKRVDFWRELYKVQLIKETETPVREPF